MTKQNEGQNIHLAEIQKDIEFIRAELINIKDNHLKSIYKKLDNQRTWLIGLLGGVIITLISTILNLIK